MNRFQLVSLIVFGFFIVIGVAVFALGRVSNTETPAVATIWGTMSEDVFENALVESALSQDRSLSITYVQKNPSSFDQELLEALAAGRGPDLFFLQNDGIIKHREKIFPIPYDSYPARNFVNNFSQVGEIFLVSDGVLALPMSVDPLVMYWNRDIFSNAGLANPPRYWSEFYDLSNLLTKKDASLNVVASAAPLGEFSNIANSFDILGLLFMQAGSSIVQVGGDGILQSSLREPSLAAERAVTFFTEFANPLRPYYSWNRSLPNSKTFFLAGNLGVYFGFASELTDLRLKNPNLDFDVTSVPQTKDAEKLLTISRVNGLAISRSSPNIAGAYAVATRLSDWPFTQALAKNTNLPPVRRDLLSTRPNQLYLSVFYNAAIQSRAWLVPDGATTPAIFKEMIESVTGGRSTAGEAVARANEMLTIQLGQ